MPDEEAGQTKAWLVLNRNRKKRKKYFDHAYGKREYEELFDLKTDPHQMVNVAGKAEYSEVLKNLRNRVFRELRNTGDPRLIDDGKFFETPPMAGPLEKSK